MATPKWSTIPFRGNSVTPISRSPRHDPDHPTHAPTSAIPGATVDAVRDLTLDLIGALVPAIGPDHNTVCSGYGLWCALAVILAGSDEDTAKSLSLALRTDQPTAASGLGALDQRLRDISGASHELAVWSRVPTYRALRESLAMVEFGSLGDHTGLNPPVRGNTRGVIPQSPIAITDDAVLTLVDTLCLAANWSEPFSRIATTSEPFTRADGGSVDVPTMHRSLGRDAAFAIYGAGPRQRTTVVSLVCQPVSPVIGTMDGLDRSDTKDGDGGPRGVSRAHLRIALGPPGMTAMAVVHDLLADSHTRLGADRVDVRLPRFTTRSRHDLAGPLESMGLGGLFRAGADLSKLSPEPVVLSQAVQEVAVDVVEQDEDAGTANDIWGGALSLTDPTVIDLAFDRPFAYALVDADLNLPILAGWVADPSATA